MLSLSAAALADRLDRPPIEGGSGPLRLRRYWSYREVVRDGLASPITDGTEALERLEQTLAEAIKGQSMADVPVGAFLSGGVDSSTIVALYQKYSPTPVRTYSIGFEERGFDEAHHARAIAKHLGTVHHEHYVTLKQARDVIPLLPTMYDEPFADSSQIPTYLVSRYARDEVTVAMTGDGGDELFAGYRRHYLAPQLWKQLSRVPGPVRSIAAGALGHVPPGLWAAAANLVSRGKSPFFGAKVRKGLRIARSIKSFDELYPTFLDEWSMERSPVIGGDDEGFRADLDAAPDGPLEVRMMYCDAVSYLPGDILCKVDRASMAVSLETRVPFLDHRVAALAAQIPIHLKVRGVHGKHILRELLFREVPRELFDRPKAGFAVPVGEWIKGELRPWAEDLLDPGRMAGEGWFDASIVQRRWRDHIDGRRDSTAALWAILMFQAWLREQQTATALAA
jgi:asparagine synthase (glutamine-hydrolysing)